jgi:hypothetical protein
MAANTLSEWVTEKSVSKDGFLDTKCTCLIDAANVVAWTKKTPTFLNPNKPWTLLISFSGATDTGATPLDIYLGYNNNAALSGTSAVTASNAVKYKQVLDDCGYTDPTIAKAIIFDPNLAVADVVTISAVADGLKVKVPAMPYYLFNITANSGQLLAVTVTFRIIQYQKD